MVEATLFFRFKKEHQRHETIRLMVEKGAAIPPQLLVSDSTRRSDLRRGILLLAAGLGVTVFFAIVAHKEPAWSLGLIPAFIGAGYLLTWWIETHRARGQSDEQSAVG